MKKTFIACLAFTTSVFCAAAFSAPGEYWEVTTKMEMPGMPFAMPAMTHKVCIPKGGEKDPRQSAPNNPQQPEKNKDCEMTDIKMSGNKASWKVRCNQNGDIMNGSGESTANSDSYEGKMHMSGKSEGHNVDMTQTYRGKRIGGSCDTEEQIKKIQSEICDTAKLDIYQLIDRSDFLLNNPTCSGKKDPLCNAVRRDAPRDADIYQHLRTKEKDNGNLITRTCGLNMDTITKSLCKTINDKNFHALSAYCPAEAKAYREAERKKECEGRDYTSRDSFSNCLNWQDGENSASENAVEKPQSKGDEGKSISGTNNPAESIIEGAKKLKGLFNF